MESIEERLVSVERRLTALLNSLPEWMKQNVEREKRKMIDETGTEYTIQAEIETDLGIKTIQFKVKAWSEKHALYIANQDIIYPNLSKKKEEGLIKWFKTIHKQIVK
jgi:ribosomal protein L31